jgi:subtilisin family serine protease
VQKIVLLVGAFAFILAGTSARAEDRPGNLGVSVDLREEVRDSFIFVFTDGVAASEVSGRANALARGVGGRVTRVYTTALKGFAAKMPDDAATRLVAANPSIAYYEPDAIAFGFPKPPWAGPGGGGEEDAACAAQVTPWGIARLGGPADGTGLTAWVIDTGIDMDHGDLNVDAARSANFVTRGKDSPNDGNGHGTHVAGTIAAIDNTCDVVGVAAGATVVAVRVLGNNGSGSYAGVIAGVDYVAANADPGDVANMSLGGPRSQALNDAVQGAASAGVFFALAAGNSAADADGYSPASAEGPNIHTVSAIDSGDLFAGFSNFGNPPVDCAAPGVNVLSTSRGGGTTTYSGTSMAAPHVAGLLLFGEPGSDGTAVGDPDGSPDPICHF